MGLGLGKVSIKPVELLLRVYGLRVWEGEHQTWPGVLPSWAEPMSLIKPRRGCTSATRSLLMVAPRGPFGRLPSVNLPAQSHTTIIVTGYWKGPMDV